MKQYSAIFLQHQCTKYCSDCYVVTFFGFYFIDALQSDSNSDAVYVLQRFFGLLKSHFNPCFAVGAKMSQSGPQNTSMPTYIHSTALFFIVSLDDQE